MGIIFKCNDIKFFEISKCKTKVNRGNIGQNVNKKG